MIHTPLAGGMFLHPEKTGKSSSTRRGIFAIDGRVLNGMLNAIQVNYRIAIRFRDVM